MPPVDGKPPTELQSSFRANVETVLLGEMESVDLAIASFIAGGHVLIEDVPGTGMHILDADRKSFGFPPLRRSICSAGFE